VLSTLRYRADIDGLRAIAVLMVLVFHAGIPWLKGGFVGVDVFFVLTGFLITSILLKEAETGTIRFKNFYLRRIRRLLPALVTVLLSTAVASWFVLLPDDFIALMDSLRYSMASIGNFWFWHNTGGYFDSDIEILPLLHTWSLAVEEQFYLLWPATVLLAHRFLSRRAQSIVLGVVVLGGAAFSQWSALQAPQSAYFLLPARVFEILLGAVVAREIERVPDGWRRGRTALAVVGIALVVVPGFVLSAQSTFPGFNALWPCLGTAVLILTNSGETTTLVNRALGWRPLVVIGLLSYSIYLWHWPIIALLNYQGIEIQGVTQLLVITGPIALAAVSYVVVERPFRYRLKLGFGPALGLLVLLPIAVSAGAYEMTNRSDGFPDRFAGGAEALRKDEIETVKGACTYGRDLETMPSCYVGIRGEKIDGLVVGDSYAGMYTKFLNLLARDAGLSLRHVWFRLSPPIPGTSVGKKPSRKQRAYIDGRHQMLDDYDIAILVSVWGNYDYGPEVEYRLWEGKGRDVSAQANALQMKAIDDLLTAGVQVVLVDRPPAPPGKKFKKMRAAVARGEDLTSFRMPIKPRANDYFIKQVEEKYPDVLIIRPFEVLCDEETCAADVDGTLIYREDGSHLSHVGAEALGEFYLRRRQNPLKRLRQSSN